MIVLRDLSSTSPELKCSRLLTALQKTFGYITMHGEIGLTNSKAFNRKFAHWAAEHYEWPEYSTAELLKINKVLDEVDVLPVMVVHDLMMLARLGRQYKGAFRLTTKANSLADNPGALFAMLVDTYLFQYNHARTTRFEETAPGNWEIFLNIINVEAEGGVSEAELVKTFYGLDQEHKGFDREYHMHKSFLFSHVLRPLSWIGFLTETRSGEDFLSPRIYTKTPLWRTCLQLDTDDMVRSPLLN